MKKHGSINATGQPLYDRWGRSLLVAVLLVFAVLLSAISGIYAGASFSPQQPPNYTVTTTVSTTTTSWITLTTWFTDTEVVLGVLTTTTFTTSTSTVTVIASTSTTSSTPTIIGTSVTITQTTGTSGLVSVKGVLRDASGKGLEGLQLRVTVDGGYTGRVATGPGGSFAYSGYGPAAKGTHVVTVWFDKTAQYTASAASVIYKLL